MKDSQEIVKDMADFVNCFPHSAKNKLFIEGMLKEHLTLQQNFTRLCMMWFAALAEQKFVDDRNRASVQLAKKITKEFGKECLPFI